MVESPAKIYLIPSPIAPGTQGLVLTPQVLNIIGKLEYYLVENIRTSRRFIASLKIRDVSELHFEVVDKRTTHSELEKLLQPVKDGHSVGIISEAGCPVVADPGSNVVKWAHQNQIQVIPLTGPSSILLALIASGMNGQHFEFHGYLPIDANARAKKLRSLEKESTVTGKTQIFMETPYRNQALLKALMEQCQSSTLLCVASNLTATDEMVRTKRVDEWRTKPPDLHKKPTIFLLQTASKHN